MNTCDEIVATTNKEPPAIELLHEIRATEIFSSNIAE